MVSLLKRILGGGKKDTAPAYPEITDEVIVDLDAVLGAVVKFRWKNKTHTIAPMTSEQFFRVTEAMEGIAKLARGPKEAPDKFKKRFVDVYTGVFSIACPSIKRGDVEAMTLTQCGQLLNLVAECVQGKAQKKS